MKTKARSAQTLVSSAELGRGQHPHRTRRFLLWCLANFVLLPVLNLVARPLRLFDFLFVVYPGSQNNIRAYTPLWFQKNFKGMFQLSLIGVMTRGEKTGRGLIATLPSNPDALTPEELKKAAEKSKRLAGKLGVSAITLAGRLPTLFSDAGIPLDPPFVRGDRGAVFTITETYLHLVKEEGMSYEDTVGVIGLGYLGSKVASRLQELEVCKIVGYDIRVKESTSERGMIRTNDPSQLSSCRIVILLTPKGEDIAIILHWLREDVVVIDDTHPQIPPFLVQQILKRGGEVYRSTLGIRGVQALPRLPGYHANWLPGCVVEALILDGTVNGLTPAEFERKGRKIGLKPFLVAPRGEG